MADARILKFDVGSSTDNLLTSVKNKLEASSGIEAMRRGLAIADVITDMVKVKKKRLFVESEDGTRQEIIIS